MRCKTIGNFFFGAVLLALLSPIARGDINGEDQSDPGVITACSKSLCDRVGFGADNPILIQSNDQLGLEYYHYRKVVKVKNEKTYLDLCRLVALFPSAWTVYTPDGSNNWRETIPSLESLLLDSIPFGEDYRFMYGKATILNLINSYIKVIKVSGSRESSISQSLSAEEIHKEVIPGLAMVKLDSVCHKIGKEDRVSILIPKVGAYRKGVDKTRPVLSLVYFNEIVLPQDMVVEISKINQASPTAVGANSFATEGENRK